MIVFTPYRAPQSQRKSTRKTCPTVTTRALSDPYSDFANVLVFAVELVGVTEHVDKCTGLIIVRFQVDVLDDILEEMTAADGNAGRVKSDVADVQVKMVIRRLVVEKQT